jgi:hypothetical protein
VQFDEIHQDRLQAVGKSCGCFHDDLLVVRRMPP